MFCPLPFESACLPKSGEVSTPTYAHGLSTLLLIISQLPSLNIFAETNPSIGLPHHHEAHSCGTLCTTPCERVIGTMNAFHAYILLPYFSTIKENAKSCQLKLGVLTLPRRDNKGTAGIRPAMGYAL